MRAEALTTDRLFPRSWETGGILLGYFDDACQVAWVTAAERPSSDSVRGAHAFRHGTAGVAARVDWHQQASGGRVRFLGMWHTHPSLPAGASDADDQAMASLLVPVTASHVPRRAVQVIVGGNADRWNYWLQGIGQPEISFRLFRRGQVRTPVGASTPTEQEH
jgi:integrative and conjugative element protein (TIGR02256 family)